MYLGNLPFTCDSAEVAGIIQEHGSVEMVEVIYDRNTGTSRGFGFATMSSVEDVNAVVENLDGSVSGDMTIRWSHVAGQVTRLVKDGTEKSKQQQLCGRATSSIYRQSVMGSK